MEELDCVDIPSHWLHIEAEYAEILGFLGHMIQESSADPLAAMGRNPDDSSYALDHFPIKLLTLAAGMHLPAARAEAARRQKIMLAFLAELDRELQS